MALSTRTLLIAIFIFFLQIASLWIIFHSYFSPPILKLEKSSVEKNLHRNIEVLQRELFYLGRMAQLIAQQTLALDLLTSQGENSTVEKKMNDFELNFLYVLDKDHKVKWESVYDLIAEQPYPSQNLISSLWETKPSFFDHNSTFSLQAGLYSSSLGPSLLVSAPILNKNQQIDGTLLIGKIISSEMLQLLQSIAVTDLQIWPLGTEQLTSQQQAIVEQILANDGDFLIERNANLLRGYMILPDLTGQPKFLLSTTQNAKLMPLLSKDLITSFLIFTVGELCLLLLLLFMIKQATFSPLNHLIKQLEQLPPKSPLLDMPPLPSFEVKELVQTLNQCTKQQQTYWQHQTRAAYKKGIQDATEHLENELAVLLPPLFNEMTIDEKKLSSLPINELAEIIAQSKAKRIDYNKFDDYIARFELINERLKSHQKEMRQSFFDIHSRLLRSLANLRMELRLLMSEQGQILLSKKQKKESKVTRS